ncbi:beta-N-acetylhexosaminidase (plasmid) [Pedobacter sp. BS3]|uniref:beta-N-acetylhexosaminidase n=1 Tax=Pedobacter sp. BS3 TaxID=2567937 RepID=UPI0011EEE277|nr:beta-N-acetylhexosaminidase [Pedobacter sp. BS3]TZF86372.1 beta-N-acetylhexosaminidase [Pedobacter sp. BS3]
MFNTSFLRIIICFAYLFSSGLVLYAQESERYPLIPKPVKLVPGKGYFDITAKTKVILDNNNPALKTAAGFLIELIEHSTGYKLGYGNKGNHKNSICFSIDNTIVNDEGYQLSVTGKIVMINYKTPRGAFWAVQTLRQLMPPDVETKDGHVKNLTIPAVQIEDTPRFAYRGALLDVARHFFSVEFIKKYIDALSFYKINTLHLHLNDDQGWRIAIEKYPRLQTVAAWRKETLVGHRLDVPEKFDGKPHGGYYTRQQLEDLVAYAGKHFMTIIPEIDVPGHSQAILAAYPNLGCKADTTYEVSTRWGVHKEILCPKEETFKFLEDVLTEVMDIFPSKYIHIGGDEVPKDRWKESAYCQNLIRTLNLKDEHGLQSYFIGRLEKFLNSKGREIIGWDEILEGGLAPNATLMSWHGEKGGIAAARQNHQVIMTPSAYTYVNLYQTKDRKQEPFSNGGFLPLEKVYSYNPVPAGLTPDEARYILGTQACLWTEYVTNERDAEFMTFPRACALAEVGWTSLAQKDYNGFLRRLNYNLRHLDKMKMDFFKYYSNAN